MQLDEIFYIEIKIIEIRQVNICMKCITHLSSLSVNVVLRYMSVCCATNNHPIKSCVCSQQEEEEEGEVGGWNQGQRVNKFSSAQLILQKKHDIISQTTTSSFR